MNEVLHIDTAYTVLSGRYRVYKTERLLKQTARIQRVDAMLDAVAGGVLRYLSDANGGEGYRYVATTDRLHAFWVRIMEDALIFCGYDSPMESIYREDTRFAAFLSANRTFDMTIAEGRPDYPSTDFEKLYKLSLTDGVYFPCLNPAQRELVTLEDANVLVQGVAGSGKTNVCIDKILFCASRNYGGNVLYTTYSRGLLMDTRMRVERWKDNVVRLAAALQGERVIFCDEHRQAAVVNRLGLYLEEDCTQALAARLQQIVAWLDSHVHYRLIQDVYTQHTGKPVAMADEDYFVHVYMGEMRNYYLSGRLDKIKHLSAEVIYKEIFGLIEGWCDPSDVNKRLDAASYATLRRDSFAKSECDTIFGIAEDYAKHLTKAGREDNNTLSRYLLSQPPDAYSLVIADEVQDFGQVTLVLLARMGRKMFAVGDALQMINPSYFNFAYLKRLLFDKETARVRTLTHNYRSGERIQDVIEQLGVLNEARFGTHNFVLRGTSVADDGNTRTCYVPDDGTFMEALRTTDLGDLTVIVADRRTKDDLRGVLTDKEVLTVSEIKGLERDNVLLYHLLGTNMAQWQAMERKWIDRKTADENSVYRYYFNLFYVGVSRARRNLYVLEAETPPMFDELLLGLTPRDTAEAMQDLVRVAGKHLDEAEQLARVQQFLSLGQYENAMQAAAKLPDAAWQQRRVGVYAQYVSDGRYREAGIALWRLGATEDARKCFEMGDEHALIRLMDATLASGENTLGVEMLRYYPDLTGNEDAQHALVELIQDDLTRMRAQRKALHDTMKTRK